MYTQNARRNCRTRRRDHLLHKAEDVFSEEFGCAYNVEHIPGEGLIGKECLNFSGNRQPPHG